MKFFLYAVSVLFMSLAVSFVVYKAIKDGYETRIDELEKQWGSENTTIKKEYEEMVRKRDKEITSLTLENINLTHTNDDLVEKYNDIKQKYGLKTSMCLGLQKNARLWHESYEELESHINDVKEKCSELMNNKESEHQKEIEDLTRYYREKISHYTQPVLKGDECENAD